MNRDRISTTIKHIDRETWELAKAFLQSEHGTHYANLGEFISYCIRYTLANDFNVRDFKSLNSGSKSNFHNNISEKKKEMIVNMCKEFAEEFPEDKYTISTIRNIIVRALAESGQLAPSKQTIYNYINFFIANRALIRDTRSGNYIVRPKRFKEILERLVDDSSLSQ